MKLISWRACRTWRTKPLGSRTRTRAKWYKSTLSSTRASLACTNITLATRVLYFLLCRHVEQLSKSGQPSQKEQRLAQPDRKASCVSLTMQIFLSSALHCILPCLLSDRLSGLFSPALIWTYTMTNDQASGLSFDSLQISFTGIQHAWSTAIVACTVSHAWSQKAQG